MEHISPKNEKEELLIQDEINGCIDKFENMIFNAGAGAGKTYALIESLKYIIENYSEQLEKNNQFINCITYTNVATMQIRDRLGNSELVKVSTIHEKLWDIINDYQEQLLLIHKDKLSREIENLIFELNENRDEKIEPKYRYYRNLSPDEKNLFKGIMIVNKDTYYSAYNLNAGNFRSKIEGLLTEFPGKPISNKSNFISTVDKIIKIDNYKQCLLEIETNKITDLIVRYDARYNSDVLHRFIISHDTLLEYSLEIVSQYDMLKQIIIDTFPYILVDEYQDTNPHVVKILKHLDDYSKIIGHNCFIGYFGDTAQNIYNDGVGSDIGIVHPGLKKINKRFNRRSFKEIIDVANLIRNDEISQESIFTDYTGGSCEFYTNHTNPEIYKDFIEKYKAEWEIDNKNKLHCLVLTNKLVAQYSGFSNIYEAIAGSKYYRKNYININTELLSNDLKKLGDIPLLLYRIFRFKEFVSDSNTPVLDVFNQEEIKKITAKELIASIEELKEINCESLETYINGCFDLLNLDSSKKLTKVVLTRLLGEDIKTREEFDSFFIRKIFNPYNEDGINTNELISTLLNIEMVEYRKWYNFINDDQDSEVEYHTYHGTKGDEYQNVIIIMKNDFGPRERKKFSSFFENVLKFETLNEDTLNKFTATKNLLYVSCTRAKKNLRILYLDDISNFEEGIKSIFDEVQYYEYLDC